MRPCSAISCRCWSRCVGAVSAVSLGTAPERGGTMIRASGWRSATERETPSWSYAPSPVNDASGAATWSSKGPTCEPSSTSWVVSSDATIRALAEHLFPVVSGEREKAVVGENDWIAGFLCGREHHRHSGRFSGDDEWAKLFPKPLDFGFGDLLLSRFVRFIRQCPYLLSVVSGAGGS